MIKGSYPKLNAHSLITENCGIIYFDQYPNYMYLQGKRFVPDRVQRSFYGFSFLLGHSILVWYQFHLHVGVGKAIRVHWNKISSFSN